MRENSYESSLKKSRKKQNMLKPSGNRKINLINSNNLITNLSSSNSSNISNISSRSGQRENLIDNNSIFLNDFVDVGEDDILNESTIGVTSKKRNLKQEKEADEQKRAVAEDLGGGSWFARFMGWDKPKIPKGNVTGLDKIRYGYVNTDYFNFQKNRAYRKDEELQKFKTLLDAYNHQGGTAEQEIKLMEAAVNYINKHSTGKTAKHKGRTAMMEDVLYQLTMQGGTKEKADANVDRLKAGIKATPMKNERQNLQWETGEAEKYMNSLRDTMAGLKGIYQGGSTYSPAMQMIVADVMSRQGKTNSISAASSSRSWGYSQQNDYGVNIDSEPKAQQGYKMGTGLHEFTHLASQFSFANSDIPFTFSQDESAKEIDALTNKRYDVLMTLLNLSHNTPENNKWNRSDAAGAMSYAGGFKAKDLYIKGFRSMYDKWSKDEKYRNDPKMQKFIKEDLEKINAAETVIGNNRSDLVVEYDSVIPQMLLGYEESGLKRDKQYYRLLKAAALDAHVRRRIAGLKNMKRG